MPGIGEMGYIALTAFAINVVRRGRAQRGAQRDEGVQRAATRPSACDYFADADDPRVQKDLAEHDTHDDPYGDPDDIPGNAAAR